MLSTLLPSLVDVAYAAFALWTLPALFHVLTGRDIRFVDPLKVLGLVLTSSRYSFVAVRWIYGAHREAFTHAELIGRNAAQIWALAVLLIAIVVIRGYKVFGE